MRQEHEELRARKRRLAELVERAGSTTHKELAKELAGVGSYIAVTLKDHIYKGQYSLSHSLRHLGA